MTPSAAPAEAKPRAQNERGWLAATVDKICIAYEEGKLPKTELDPPETKLTPHRVAAIVAKRTGKDAPSTGAVTAVFDRWAEFGYANFHPKPKAFKSRTAAGKKLGLDGVIAKRNEDRKKARAKDKAAAKAAAASTTE